MLLSQLRVNNVRNIKSATLDFDPLLTIIIGENGSGKTSLLEALSFLSRGRSFRTNQVKHILNTDSQDLTVSAKLLNDALTVPIAIQRQRSGLFRAKVNGQLTSRLADLSRYLPYLVLYPSLYEEVSSSRSHRLKLLDWGLFHVEQSYFELWQSFNRVLKQRNQLLKMIQSRKASEQDLTVWTDQLVSMSSKINAMRSNFILEINQFLLSNSLVKGNDTLELLFQSGWSKNTELSDTLSKNLKIDIQRGFTSVGCHKADFKFKLGEHWLFETGSRGQLKMAINSLYLALINAMEKAGSKQVLLGLDDVSAELDDEHQGLLFKAILSQSNVQLVATSITEDSLPESISRYNGTMFHVEHGQFHRIK